MEGIFLRSRNLRINLYEMYFERQIFNKNSLINFLMIFHYVFFFSFHSYELTHCLFSFFYSFFPFFK